MFRLQENVPEIYVKASRDFQLFCRIYDVINNSIRFNAKSIDNLLNPMLASDRILPLLATKVGFFPKHEYNTNALREVISAFPFIVKYKGSKLGIEMALNVILKIENNYDQSFVFIDSEHSLVGIYTKNKIKGEDLLRDVLSYIIPIGYDLEVSTYVEKDLSDSPTQLGLQNNYDKVKVTSINNSIIVPDQGEANTITLRTLGSYTTSSVLNGNEEGYPQPTPLKYFDIEGTTIYGWSNYGANEYNHARIRELAFPNKNANNEIITDIHEDAFHGGYPLLRSIFIPIPNIGNEAFIGDAYEPNGLVTLVLGSDVTYIGRYAFGYQNALTSITIKATIPPILASITAFSDTNNCPIYVPAQSVELYRTATNWSAYASRIQAEVV